MKVALLIPSLDVGGSERNIVVLGEVLAAAGFDVEIWLTSSGIRQLPTRLTVVRLIAGTSALHGLTILRRISAIVTHTRRFHPDCVISFLESSNIPALLASLRTRVPTVVSVRGNPERFNLFYRCMTFLFYRRARSVVLPSREGAAHLARHYFLRNTVAIPNFLAVDRVLDDRLRPGAGKQLGPLVAIGRLVPGKRFDDVIDVAGRLLPQRELLIIGDGPERGRLEQVAARSPVTVRFCGALPHTEVLAALDRASALISMSVSECWPNAVAEALATGTPVIARDCNFGPREMLADGENGFLIREPADASARAEISAALLDATAYANLCRHAAERAASWSLSSLLPKWVEQISGDAP